MPTSILTASDLKGIGLSGDYIQMADIDMAGESYSPKGNSNGTKFSGSYDGNGYKILNLSTSIASSVTDGVGLFGAIEGATLKNIELIGVNTSGWYNVAAIAGWGRNSTIEDCKVFGGVVRGIQGMGDAAWNVGPIIGQGRGVSINRCGNTASVEGYNDMGGIAGFLDEGCSLSQVFSTGDVTGLYELGGIVGMLRRSTISDAYSWGNVSGQQFVGNVIGRLNAHSGVASSAHRIYGLGRVIRTDDDVGQGPLVGGNYNSTTSYCYYKDSDTGVMAQNYAYYPSSKYGSGHSDGQMKKGATFQTYDFEVVWLIVDDVMYPCLRWYPGCFAPIPFEPNPGGINPTLPGLVSLGIKPLNFKKADYNSQKRTVDVVNDNFGTLGAYTRNLTRLFRGHDTNFKRLQDYNKEQEAYIKSLEDRLKAVEDQLGGGTS